MGWQQSAGPYELLAAAEQGDCGVNQACRAILAAIRAVMPFRAGSVNTIDPETLIPSGGLVVGLEREECEPFWNNEVTEIDERDEAALGPLADPIATLSGTSSGILRLSPRFQAFYAERGIDEMRIAFLAGDVILAIGVFIRQSAQGPFRPREVAEVRALLPDAIRLLRRSLACDAQRQRVLPPVMVIVGPDDTLTSVSEGGHAVLDDLRQDISCGCDDRLLPETLRGAVILARSRGGMSSRLLGRTGHWRRMQASPLTDGGGGVAVMLSSVPASELVHIVMGSYGFTAREHEVVVRLAQGLAIKEIAHDLVISAHTVQDHVKAIYRKAGVGSRGELVADVLAPLLPVTPLGSLR